MGGFQNIASSIGSVGNDVANARQGNADLATKAAADKLKQIMAQLQIQEIQQKLAQSGQPQPMGIQKTPEGGLSGFTYEPGVGYKAQPLAPGAPPSVDKEKFRTSLLEYANRPDATALEKRVMSGLIGSLDSGMAPEKVMEDYNRFLASRSETGTEPKPELKTEIFSGYLWQYDPTGKVPGTRDATKQYVRLGLAKEPGTGESGTKTPFELWLRTHPNGTYDQWIQASKQEDRADAVSSVKGVMAAYRNLQALNTRIAVTNRSFSIWNPSTYSNDPALKTIADQVLSDYDQKRQDAIEKLTDAGMPIPAWLNQSVGGPTIQPPGGYVLDKK